MKLQFSKRNAVRKSEAKAIRRTGNIPACVYVRGKESEHVEVNGPAFEAFLRNVQPGHLSTSVMELSDGSNNSFRAIVKEIQYHPTSYAILHLDFERLVDDVKVNIKVPIECQGVVDCVGVKLGGVIRQVLRHLRVRCLPKDIPTSFPLDVRSMGLRDQKRLKDLSIPENVRPLADMNEVAVVIAKR